MRFPECLRLDDAVVSPFAVQPGQVLMPETCGVALRIDGAAGSWLGVWRPAARRLLQRAAPEGWLAGAGLWTAEGVLRLPCSTGPVPVSVVDIAPLGEVPCDLSIELSMGVGTEPAQVEVPGQEPCGPLTLLLCASPYRCSRRLSTGARRLVRISGLPTRAALQ